MPRSASLPMCSKRTASKRATVVTFYLPMIPELAIGILACTRIGAIHSVVFGGFSADALATASRTAKASW
jgi:acetyl-CoA synthetase